MQICENVKSIDGLKTMSRVTPVSLSQDTYVLMPFFVDVYLLMESKHSLQELLECELQMVLDVCFHI